MAVSSCSLSWAPSLLSNKTNVASQLSSTSVSMASPPCTSNAASASSVKESDTASSFHGQCIPASKVASSCFPFSTARVGGGAMAVPKIEKVVVNCGIGEASQNAKGCCQRRSVLIGGAALAIGITPARSLLAEVPANYSVFVDKEDGYSYYYPSDWREFDFRAHDSAFKDRYLQLQNVRLSFIPTDKADVHELGPMEEYIPDLVKNNYAAPNQWPTIFDMKERTSDGRSYYTVEFVLTSPNFARSAFATIAIANGRYYTLIVGANGRRWKRIRNKLKVVADSFKVFNI